jgi:hypothetical protein
MAKKSAKEPEPEQALQRQPVSLPGRSEAMSTAMRGLVPQTLGEAFQLATYLAKSEVIPKSLRQKPESVLAVIMQGIELGLTPLMAVNNITIISGNMALKANLQLAIVRNSGLLATWDEGFVSGPADDDTKTFGWCEVARVGVKDRDGKLKVFRREFSVANAKKVTIEDMVWSEERHRMVPSGQTSTLADKDNYQNWPERMYPYRARSWVLESVFGDILKGLPSVEGIEGGQIIQAEVVDVEPDADALLAAIRDASGEVATSIELGFDALAFPPGRRLQKLKEYKDRPADLAEWLRKEYSERRGKAYEPKKKSGDSPANGKAPVVIDVKPAQTSEASFGPTPSVTVAVPVAVVKDAKAPSGPLPPLTADDIFGKSAPENRKGSI